MISAMIGFSADPLTNGHLWMIQQGFKRFELNLAIAVNPDKKYTFTEREREDMLSEALIGALGDRAKEVHIHVIPHLYLARFAESTHCHLLLRGIRNDDDFKYERSIRHANAKLCPDVDTLYMIPPLELEAVSSSFVKGWIGPSGWEKEIIEYIPPVVYYALLAKNHGSYYCYGVGGKMGKGCEAKLTQKEKIRVIKNNGGYCDKCIKEYETFMQSR